MAEGKTAGVIYLDLQVVDKVWEQIGEISRRATAQAAKSFGKVGTAASEAVEKPLETINDALEKPIKKAAEQFDELDEIVKRAANRYEKRFDRLRNTEFSPAAVSEKAPDRVQKPEPEAPRSDAIVEPLSKAVPKARELRDLFQASTDPLELMRQKLDNVAAQLAEQENKLRSVRTAYDEAVKGGNFESDEALKLDSQATAIQQRMISLQQTATQTEEKIKKALAAAETGNAAQKNIGKAKTGFQQLGNAAQTAGEKVKKALAPGTLQKPVEKTAGLFSRFGKTATKTMDRAQKRTAASAGGIGKSFHGLGMSIKSSLKSAFLMAGLYAFFKSFKDLLGGAVGQNKQFMASLNAVKGNLSAAFLPIIQAIMPALNTLMAGLAKATQALAVFISGLFGKTYAQSVAAAKQLQTVGNTAKKAKKELSMGSMDELNVLSEKDTGGSEESSGIDYDALTESPTELPAWLNTITEKLQGIWGVFKSGWDTMGAGVIAASTAAFDSLKAAASAVFGTLYDAFTGGAGERWFSSLLQAGTSFLLLIGDIGQSFATVWNNGTGLQIWETLFSIGTNVNMVVSNLCEQIRKAWNESGNGEKIWQHILDILNNVLGFFDRISAATATWASGLDFSGVVGGVEQLLGAAEKLQTAVLGGLAEAYEKILLPLGKWVIEDAAPAALSVLTAACEALSQVVSAMLPGLEGFVQNGLAPIAEWAGGVIVDALGFLSGELQKVGEWFTSITPTISAFGTNLGELVGRLWEFLEPLLDTAWESFKSILSTIVDGLTAFGGKLLEAGAAFWDALTAVWDFLDGLGLLDAIISNVMTWIERLRIAFETVFKLLGTYYGAFLDVLKNGFNFIKSVFTGDWEGAWQAISDLFTDIFDAIKEFWGILWDGISQYFEVWKTNFITIWNSLWNGISTFFTGIWTGFQTLFGTVLDWFCTKWEEISAVFKEAWEKAWNGISEFFQKIWDGIKQWLSDAFAAITNLWTEFSTGFQTAWEEAWNGIQKFFTDIWDGLKKGFNEAVQWISTTWEETSKNFKNSWENMWRTVGNFFIKIWNGIVGGFESAVNWIIDGVNSLISSINRMLSSMGDLLDAVGLNFRVSVPSLPRVRFSRIPMLANGGYVGPNAPQLAVIGDNKREGEIVAPESKIAEAVAIGVSSAMEQILGVLSNLRPTDSSGTPIIINIGGEKLDSFILSAENRRNLRSGGR